MEDNKNILETTYIPEIKSETFWIIAISIISGIISAASTTWFYTTVDMPHKKVQMSTDISQLISDIQPAISIEGVSAVLEDQNLTLYFKITNKGKHPVIVDRPNYEFKIKRNNGDTMKLLPDRDFKILNSFPPDQLHIPGLDSHQNMTIRLTEEIKIEDKFFYDINFPSRVRDEVINSLKNLSQSLTPKDISSISQIVFYKTGSFDLSKVKK